MHKLHSGPLVLRAPVGIFILDTCTYIFQEIMTMTSMMMTFIVWISLNVLQWKICKFMYNHVWSQIKMHYISWQMLTDSFFLFTFTGGSLLLLLLPSWADTLPGWLGICLHPLHILKSSHDLPQLWWNQQQPWRCLGGGIPETRWGRELQGGQPQRSRLRRCRAALKRWEIPAK